jgi:predicted nucleotide-binding protein
VSAIGRKIGEFVEAADGFASQDEYVAWEGRVRAFLETALDAATASSFFRISNTVWTRQRDSQVGFLEGLLARGGEEDSPASSASLVRGAAAMVVQSTVQSKKVFVVHGHDNEAKETVARFLERLGLEPIILHEQPNEGRTVIEKFEHHADVGFAVVLLTPDDVGAVATEADKLKLRARQNVVLELGYFLGSLRRSRVCALYKGGVEVPSDYQGVLYVELDQKGAWRTRLAQELANAGLKINLEALLKS